MENEVYQRICDRISAFYEKNKEQIDMYLKEHNDWLLLNTTLGNHEQKSLNNQDYSRYYIKFFNDGSKKFEIGVDEMQGGVVGGPIVLLTDKTPQKALERHCQAVLGHVMGMCSSSFEELLKHSK